MSHRRFAFIAFLMLATFSAMSARADTVTDQEWADAANIVADPPLDYTTCMSPGDCRIVNDPCGNPRPINKTHAEQYFRMAKRLAQTINCAAPADDRTKPDIDCEQGICKVQTVKP